MADRIKLRRGPKNKMDLNVYELGYATDSTEKRLYFNDGSMVPIPNEKDITDIKAELTEATNVSNQNKKDVSELKESVAGIIKTGVAKLVMYSYDVKLSEDTQKVNIPYERFDSDTDTLKVYVNGIAIPNEYYTITNPVENDGIITNGYIVLTESRPADTIVRFEIWKNIPSGEEGEVSGNIIAKNSLPLDRIKDITSQLSNPNLLINGDFQVWQRGTNFNGHGVYTADRWRFDYAGNNSYISKSNNGGLVIHTEKGYRFWIEQRIEINDNLKQHISNSDITLSFYICGNETEDMRPFVQIRKVKKDSTFDTILLSQYEYKQEGSKIVKTFNVGDMTDVVGLAIGIFRLDDTNKDTILGDKYVEFKWVKLEIGNVATKFIPRLYEEELLLCQRYYEITDLDDMFVGVRELNGNFLVPYNFKVEKRAIPTIKIGHSSYGDNKMYLLTKTRGEETSIIVRTVDKNHVRIYVDTQDDVDSCAFCGWIKADAEIY